MSMLLITSTSILAQHDPLLSAVRWRFEIGVVRQETRQKTFKRREWETESTRERTYEDVAEYV